jgi:hypothetical protein
MRKRESKAGSNHSPETKGRVYDAAAYQRI